MAATRKIVISKEEFTRRVRSLYSQPVEVSYTSEADLDALDVNFGGVKEVFDQAGLSTGGRLAALTYALCGIDDQEFCGADVCFEGDDVVLEYSTESHGTDDSNVSANKMYDYARDRMDSLVELRELVGTLRARRTEG